jgi:hypothetical protein
MINHVLTSSTVLFLRHKLQRGLLASDGPKEAEIPEMSEHITQLEQGSDMDASIIRNTKINKVLKASGRQTLLERTY